MWRKMRIQCMYLVLLVILGISFTSCSVYNRYRTSWLGNDGRFAKLFDESQAGGNNRNVGDVKPDAIQSKNDNSSKSEGIGAVVSGSNSGQKKPLLDHYQELLVQLLEDEKVINKLNEKQGELDTTVKNLKAEIGDSKVKLKEEELKSLDLYKKNKELVIKHTKDSNVLKEREKGYVDEIDELKMQLVKFQINEVKTKQELVRVKTQHVMEKKRWAQ